MVLNSSWMFLVPGFIDTLNFQRFLCIVIKFHVVKEIKEAVLYFLQDFRFNLPFVDS